MSNKQYEREKNMWVNVKDDAKGYDTIDVKMIDDIPHVRRYQQLARDANRFGLAGVVVGAPSEKNHIKPEELEKVRQYFGEEGLILVPGIGAQGGEVTSLINYFGYNHIIANVGRGLMFSNGANTSPNEQAEAAKSYFVMLSKLKKAA
jgi:orotidine-5'-phosphate decarboxylase